MQDLRFDNHDTLYVKQNRQKVSIKYTFFSAIGAFIFLLYWLLYFFEKKFLFIQIDNVNDLAVFIVITALIVYRFFEETKRYDYQSLYIYKLLINLRKMCV